MALLLPNGNYFKLELNGNYTIFKNKTARNKIKKATSSKMVIDKYEEIINKLYSPEYSYYSNILELTKERAE
jgi:hypothetical protein